MVSSQDIGPNWCKVNIQVAVKKEERLTLLLNQKQEVEEARKSVQEAHSRNAELMKKFEDAEKRAELEEKLSNIESKNQTENNDYSERTPENGNVHNGEAKVATPTKDGEMSRLAARQNM
ncbi:hypothetical protein Tco_0456193 [Tanacetum coccineum]